MIHICNRKNNISTVVLLIGRLQRPLYFMAHQVSRYPDQIELQWSQTINDLTKGGCGGQRSSAVLSLVEIGPPNISLTRVTP